MKANLGLLKLADDLSLLLSWLLGIYSFFCDRAVSLHSNSFLVHIEFLVNFPRRNYRTEIGNNLQSFYSNLEN